MFCASVGWDICVLTTLSINEIENVTTDFINTVMNGQRRYLFWINSPFKGMSDVAAKAGIQLG